MASKNVLQNIGLVSIFHVTGMFMSFLTVPFLVSKLGMVSFGFYVYWMNIFTLAGMFVSAGVENVQLHKMAVSRSLEANIICEAYAIRFIPAIIVFSTFLISSMLIETVSIDLKIAFFVYIVATFLNLNWVHYARSRATFATGIDLLAKSSFFLSFLVLADNYEQALIIYSLIHLITAICFLLPLRGQNPFNLIRKIIGFPKFSKNNIDILIASIFSLPINQLVPIVAMNVFGPLFVANFGLIEKICNGVKSLYEPLGKVIIPIITKKVNEKFDVLWLTKIGITILFPFVIATYALNLFADEVFEIISRTQFDKEYLSFFVIYSATIPISALINFLGVNVLLALGNSSAYRNSRAFGAVFFLFILVLVFFNESKSLFFYGLLSADVLILISILISLNGLNHSLNR